MDAKRRAHLDRFHYTQDGDRETGEYDRRARRGGAMNTWSLVAAMPRCLAGQIPGLVNAKRFEHGRTY
jgi:hypothetical protein